MQLAIWAFIFSCTCRRRANKPPRPAQAWRCRRPGGSADSQHAPGRLWGPNDVRNGTQTECPKYDHLVIALNFLEGALQISFGILAITLNQSSNARATRAGVSRRPSRAGSSPAQRNRVSMARSPPPGSDAPGTARGELQGSLANQLHWHGAHCENILYNCIYYRTVHVTHKKPGRIMTDSNILTLEAADDRPSSCRVWNLDQGRFGPARVPRNHPQHPAQRARPSGPSYDALANVVTQLAIALFPTHYGKAELFSENIDYLVEIPSTTRCRY